MAILRGKSALKDVMLIGSIYDNNYFTTRNGKDGNAYVEWRIHPDDPRSDGQSFPELRAVLVGEKVNENGVKSRIYERRDRMYASQVEALKEAAAETTFPLTNAKGETVGQCYVVAADLVVTTPKVGPFKYGSTTERVAPDTHLAVNSKTIRSVDPKFAELVDGKNPMQRCFEKLKAVRAQKAQERQAKAQEAKAVQQPQTQAVAEATQVSAEAAVPQYEVDVEPQVEETVVAQSEVEDGPTLG